MRVSSSDSPRSLEFRVDGCQPGHYTRFGGNFRVGGPLTRPKCRFLAQTPLHQTTARSANHTTECSSMRTARPAARPPHPFFELRAHPFDMLPPCLIFLDGDGPADPLVARERRYVLPSRQYLRVGRDRLSEISRKVVYDSSGESNGCHRVIPQAKDQASDTRMQLGFQNYRGRSGSNPVLELLPDWAVIQTEPRIRLPGARFAPGRFSVKPEFLPAT
jgi:hypothetical protein